MSAFGLNTTQESALNALCAKLKTAKDELDTAINAVNDAFIAVDGEIRAYNEVLSEFNTFRNTFVTQQQNLIDEKPDGWAESQEGENVSSWLDEWRSLDLDALEELDAGEISDITALSPDLDLLDKLDEIAASP